MSQTPETPPRRASTPDHVEVVADQSEDGSYEIRVRRSGDYEDEAARARAVHATSPEPSGEPPLRAKSESSDSGSLRWLWVVLGVLAVGVVFAFGALGSGGEPGPEPEAEAEEVESASPRRLAAPSGFRMYRSESDTALPYVDPSVVRLGQVDAGGADALDQTAIEALAADEALDPDSVVEVEVTPAEAEEDSGVRELDDWTRERIRELPIEPIEAPPVALPATALIVDPTIEDDVDAAGADPDEEPDDEAEGEGDAGADGGR